MDLEYNKLYLKRAQNELNLTRIIIDLSINKELQVDIFKIEEEDTYFSSAISHAYYCIFYGAKVYLLLKGTKTSPPEEHKKTFEEFKKLVEKGIVDIELLRLYEAILVKADTLLHIFLIHYATLTAFLNRASNLGLSLYIHVIPFGPQIIFPLSSK